MVGTVLVIEDDTATATLSRDVWEAEGYRVLRAVGGAGIDAARAAHPTVILLDMHMPGMDGAAVARRLRADPATADLPIVCMSSALTRGGPPPGMPHDDCLPKPFAVAMLSAVAVRWAA